MPCYFFNVRAERPSIDEEGEELPDRHAAWNEATKMAGEMIRDIDGQLKPGQGWELEVTDEFRNPLYVLSVRARNA
jgi:hypothetical protein